jgi:hypothetical protein
MYTSGQLQAPVATLPGKEHPVFIGQELKLAQSRSRRSNPTSILTELSQRPFKKKKIYVKAVPLHAMKAPGGRGAIAPTHS